ncbi:ABC transporter substrate-binding protein [Caldinitratiruptor microaerophilus]|nr:ABC transporter substrate-binding protein [Caldinitratiruptor microaerophilus]
MLLLVAGGCGVRGPGGGSAATGGLPAGGPGAASAPSQGASAGVTAGGAGASAQASHTSLPPLSPPARVTVGMKAVPSDAGALIGMEKGYYRELGIEIERLDFKTGQDMINALATGHLDVGFTVTAAGLFNAMSRNVKMKIVADKGYNIPGKGYYRLVLRKDVASQVRDFKDLKGKRLAIVGVGSLDEIALDRILRKGGLTTRNNPDIKVLSSFPDIVVALANGSIDGGMLIEPFVQQAIQKGVGDPWKDPSEYEDNAQIAIIVYGTSMIERPDVANRFMVAYLRSLRDYNDAFMKNKNRKEIVDLLARVSTVKDAALMDSMLPAGLNPNGYVRMKGIQSDIDWYAERGMLQGGPLKAEDVVDNRYVEEALKVLGRYE